MVEIADIFSTPQGAATPLSPRNASHTTILHLTDLHFDDSTEWSPKNQSLHLNHLQTLLAIGPTQDKPDLVVATGDLVENFTTNKNKHKAHLTKAKDFLYHICTHVCNLPDSRLIVVPGNHDVRISGIKRCAWGREIFNEVFPQWKGCNQQLQVFPELNLLVVSIDSNEVEDHLGLAMGQVDETDFDKLRIALHPHKNKEFQRIAVFHHHPLPVKLAEEVNPIYRARWIERLAGRLIDGAPEFMVLRNAGRVLNFLFENQFDAVLHGHYHKHGHWRLLNVNNARRLDVLSGASLTACDKRHSYQLVKLDRFYGISKAVSNSFDLAGGNHRIEALIDDSESTQRERAWNDPLNYSYNNMHNQNFICSRLLVDYVVKFPDGDIEVTHTFKNLRASNENPQESMTIPAKATVSTNFAFEVHNITPNSGITVSRGSDSKVEFANGQYSVMQSVTFSPPLRENAIDLVCRHRMFGAMYSSAEDQKYSGSKHESGSDFVSKQVLVKTDLLVMTLKFVGGAISVHDVTHKVAVENRGLGGRPNFSHQTEQDKFCETVVWPNKIGNQASFSKALLPEMRLSVVKPIGGFTYKLDWKLPDVEPMDPEERSKLEEYRNRILEAQFEPYRRTAIKFLEELRNAILIKILEITDRDWRLDQTLVLAIFALNSTPREDGSHLICVASTNPLANITKTEIRGGRDVIGQSHRNGAITGFDRSKMDAENSAMVNLPQEIEHLVAIPLNCDKQDAYPTAILSISTHEKESIVKKIGADTNVQREVLRLVVAGWEKTYRAIMGFHEKEG